VELWRTRTGRADTILDRLLATEKLGAADRAFVVELFYGVVRNLTLLDFWIDCLRSSRIEADLRDVLRLGLYQLLILGTPEHAAVYESVELVREGLRPVVNGVLRTAVRQRHELLDRARRQPLSTRESHPSFLISRWQKTLGVEATAALCKWNNQTPPIHARINQLKIGSEHFYHRYPDAEPLEGEPDFVQFPAFPAKAVSLGHCYIQDRSTAMACRLLDPQPEETILDACAAPGGKTTYLAALMQNRGRIVACDRDPDRLAVLEQNAARLDASMIEPVKHDWLRRRLPKKLHSDAGFDRILVDAPCTNTGVMRRRVDVRWRLQPGDFLRMQKIQIEIMEKAFQLLKPGGILVYSTCSLEPEENETVLGCILEAIPELHLKEQRKYLPFRDQCDGAFAAKLVKAAAMPPGTREL
jgi:16S rRNA (cytosine967-C5)-methyltransferase